MSEARRPIRRTPAGPSAAVTPPGAVPRTPLAARRHGRSRGAGRSRLAALAAAALVLLPAGAARAQKAAEGSMVEAVVAEFAQPNRRIYVAPGLELSQAMARSGIRGRPRHTEETLEKLRQRFNATIAYPREVIECPDGAKPEKCTIPGDGMIFYFFAPERPIQNGILGIRVVLFHNGRGTGGQILREMWDVVVRREPSVGWTVMQKRLYATAQGPA